MAKKITADEQANPAGSETLHPVTENSALENAGNTVGENAGEEPGKPETVNETGSAGTKPETKPANVPQTKPAGTKPDTDNFPPFVEAILGTFPSYESLYIDAQGGIYTPATPPAVRGNATLYRNPYYKSSGKTHNS
jgi:hypothetical protein